MSDEQGNNTQDPGKSTIFNLNGDASKNSQNISDSLRIIADAIQRNPESFGIGRRAPIESQSNYAQSKWSFERERHSQPRHRNTGDPLADFETGIKEQLLDSLAGGNFKKNMQSALDTFAKEFGHDIRDLPNEAGRALTKKAMDAFGDSKVGKFFEQKAKNIGQSLLKRFDGLGDEGAAAKDGILKVIDAFKGKGQSGGQIGDLAGKLGDVVTKGDGASKLPEAIKNGGQVMNAIKGGGKGLGQLAKSPVAEQAITGIAKFAAKLGPWGLLIAGIIITAVKVLGPALKGFGELVKALGKSFNREEELRKKRVENATKRLTDDVEYMAKRPFEILEKATEEWYNAWDNNLRKIGQTQGYDKEATYALYEEYAERLREDNLASVINATDIIDKLSTVLDSGLTGTAATEFAYIATKLSAAIPTQDFFSYVDTYSSIAANAIAQGKTGKQALHEANKQLEDFASNLLYSSRELAGGFSTGLKNSSDLFNKAYQIAQSAKTYNASEISGTLTSVSAIIGAVAPDLAGSLVDNVVQAAIGGNNNTSLVALRSLAGINAGNTEFLRAMAEDPQSVFSTLFTNLANMQNMSPDNYMEVAEGLADVFGIDKAAFARVDFNYLADAISSMNTNNKSLEENLKLLESGQTTTSAEQLKAQEINSVILEEGLAYVIDSEAGRMIQQHMWDEQIANELANTEYAVSLQGAALQFLEGIRKSMTTLLNFLNPIGFLNKSIANMTQTIAESIGNDQDIKEILKLGAVGSNTTSFYNLTTRGKDLKLVDSLVEMYGGTKGTALNTVADWTRKAGNIYSNIGMGLLTGIAMPSADQFNQRLDSITGSGTYGQLADMFGASDSVRVTSRYNWGVVGKSLAKAIQSSSMNTNTIGGVYSGSSSASQRALADANSKFQEFLDTAEEASKTMTYETWISGAKDMGISDFAEALKNYGRTEEEVRAYFEDNRAQEGARQEQARKTDEQLFRDENRGFWDYTSGSSGVFQSAIWFPFFGDGQKYDTRMSAIDQALSILQHRVGLGEEHTVIGGLEEISDKLGDTTRYTVISALDAIRTDISSTFVTSSSMFQQCLRAWVNYIAESKAYTESVSKSSAWSDLQAAQQDQRNEATLALAEALKVFSAEELQKMDPQLQSNVLLGQILVVLQTIMQQNNTVGGTLTLPDQFSALAMGMTYKTGT